MRVARVNRYNAPIISSLIFMSLLSCIRWRYFAAVSFLAMLSACGAVGGSNGNPATARVPYKMDIVQGNVVTREQLAVLRIGMPRAIAQDVLGTPLLTSVFHADRWDYVFTLTQQGAAPQTRRVTLFFSNDTISRIEADELPSETEFVSTLRSSKVTGALPAMSASEDALKKYPVPVRPPSPAPADGSPAPATYPPLEPGGL